MAKEINTSIRINATPEAVWKVFASFEKYPDWNPFIKSVKGEIKMGGQINIKIQPPRSKPMKFKPRILAYEANSNLIWLGSLLFKGLFDGLHQFKLVAMPDGGTMFYQSEKFTGILVSFFDKQIKVNTKEGFEAMNKQLKVLVEANGVES